MTAPFEDNPYKSIQIIEENSKLLPADELSVFVDSPEQGVNILGKTFYGDKAEWYTSKMACVTGQLALNETTSLRVDALVCMPNVFKRLVSNALGRTPKGMIHYTITSQNL